MASSKDTTVQSEIKDKAILVLEKIFGVEKQDVLDDGKGLHAIYHINVPLICTDAPKFVQTPLYIFISAGIDHINVTLSTTLKIRHDKAYTDTICTFFQGLLSLGKLRSFWPQPCCSNLI